MQRFFFLSPLIFVFLFPTAAMGNRLCSWLLSPAPVTKQSLDLWLKKAPAPKRYSQLGMEWEGQMPERFIEDSLTNEFIGMLVKTGYQRKQLYAFPNFWHPEIWLSKKKRKRKFWFPLEHFETEPGYYPFEVAFPVIYKPKQLNLIDKSFDLLKQLEAKPSVNSGIHFHLDAKHLLAIDYVILVEIFKYLEKQIAAKWGIHEERKIFLSDHNSSLLKKLRLEAYNRLPAVAKAQFGRSAPSRSVQFNDRHSTFEIKLFNSHLDKHAIRQQVKLVKLIFDGVVNRPPWFQELLQSKEKFHIEQILYSEEPIQFPRN